MIRHREASTLFPWHFSMRESQGKWGWGWGLGELVLIGWQSLAVLQRSALICLNFILASSRVRVDYYASTTGEGSKGHNPLYLWQQRGETRQCGIEYASGVWALSVLLFVMASDGKVKAISLPWRLIVFLFIVVVSVELKETKNGEYLW